MFRALLGGLLLKLFPSMGPKGVIDTQITMYKRLKVQLSSKDENEILNSLLMSRVNAPMSPSTRPEELAHYHPLLESTEKTLEDVIWAIVEYEYLLSRGEELQNQLAAIGAPPDDVIDEISDWLSYLKEKVKEVESET